MLDFDYLTIAGTDNPITFNKSLSGSTAPPQIRWANSGIELLTFTFSANLNIPNGKTSYYTFVRPASPEYPKGLTFNYAASGNQSNLQLATTLAQTLQANWGSPTTYTITTDGSNNTILTFNTNVDAFSNSSFQLATNTQQILIAGYLQTGPGVGQVGIFSSALGNLFNYFNYAQPPLPSGIISITNILGFFAKSALGSYILVCVGKLANSSLKIVTYVSTDNGRTWTSAVASTSTVPLASSPNLDAAYDPVTNTLMVLEGNQSGFIPTTGYGKVNVSTNNGATWVARSITVTPTKVYGYGTLLYTNGILFAQTVQEDEGTGILPYYVYSYDLGLTWNVQDMTMNTDSMGNKYTITYQTIPGFGNAYQPAAGSPYGPYESSGYETGYISIVNNTICYPFQGDATPQAPNTGRPYGGSPIFSQTPLNYDNVANKYTVGNNNSTNTVPSVSAVNNSNAIWLIPPLNVSGLSNQDEWSIPFQAGPNTTLSNGLTLCGVQDNYNNAHNARGNYLITAFSVVYQGGNFNLYQIVSNTQFYKPSLSTMVSTGSQLISITPNASAAGTYLIGTSSDGFNWQTMPYTGFPSYFSFAGKNSMLYSAGNTSPTNGSITYNRTSTNPSTSKPRLAYFNTGASGNIWPAVNYLYKGTNTGSTTITGFTTATAQGIVNTNGPIANPTEGRIY